MITHLREPILARMRAICVELTGETKALRNDVHVDDTMLPILSLLDGDEHTNEQDDNVSRSPSKPRIVTMTPSICIILNEESALIGSKLNGWLEKVMRAVLFDTELVALIGANGGIDYRGLFNNFAAGRAELGYSAALFAIRYPFIPSRLLAA